MHIDENWTVQRLYNNRLSNDYQNTWLILMYLASYTDTNLIIGDIFYTC